MSGFNGINQFGSLIVNGQKLTFETFDKDGNGEISTEEYNSVLKEMKLDSVELSKVDKGGDGNISEDEFAIWEQKIEMQNAVNDLSGTISTDFAGKSEYLTELTNSLKQLIDDFANDYEKKGNDISKMAEAFKTALPAKYNELKTQLLANDPETVKSRVLDDIYTDLTNPSANTRSEGEGEAEELTPATAKRIAKELEAEANKFIKNYKGDNLEADLKAHLEEFMNKSDAEKLKDASEKFIANSNTFGAMIDNGAELKQLKEYAKEFLTAALEAGVTVKLGGTTIKTTNAITTALSKFNDGDELKAAIEDVIANLGTQTLKEKLILEEKEKAIQEADKKFNDIKGSEYAVSESLIDKTQIPGYGNQIHERGKGWSGSKDKAYSVGSGFLRQDSLKSQIKAQIKSMLESKGVPFEKIEALFEDIYNKSVNGALNSDGIITGRGARGTSSKGHAYIDTSALLTKFIEVFNTEIAKAIDEMNASDKDMDLQDLDYTAITKDENGNVDSPELTNLVEKRSTTFLREDSKNDCLEKIFTRMKPQILQKAKALCDANNVTFNLEIFNTMYNNATLTAAAVPETVNNFYVVCPAKIIDILANEFKTNYTNWVDTEKAKV